VWCSFGFVNLIRVAKSSFQLPTNRKVTEWVLAIRIRPQMKHIPAPGVLCRSWNHEGYPAIDGFVSRQVSCKSHALAVWTELGFCEGWDCMYPRSIEVEAPLRSPNCRMHSGNPILPFAIESC
jgi:hypothetical protein